MFQFLKNEMLLTLNFKLLTSAHALRFAFFAPRSTLHAPRKTCERGFTFIELIIAISVIGIISAISISSYYSLARRVDLGGNAQNIIATLNLAKSKTVASENASQWGAHFENGQYAIFKGAVYNPADPDTKIFSLPSSLEISSISLSGGGQDILFSRLGGTTQSYGTLVLRKVSLPSELITITIESSGQVSANNITQTPSGSRAIDSRHIHFTYNANVQNATTLSISFPDYPADNISLSFQDYLNQAKDYFAWEQIITVNGVSRTLRINTHLLNSSQADFSIYRERENNNEAMQVSIDGENLINYTAGGQESQGNSAWATAPVRQ